MPSSAGKKKHPESREHFREFLLDRFDRHLAGALRCDEIAGGVDIEIFQLLLLNTGILLHPTLFPYTTLFRSREVGAKILAVQDGPGHFTDRRAYVTAATYDIE